MLLLEHAPKHSLLEMKEDGFLIKIVYLAKQAAEIYEEMCHAWRKWMRY